MEIIPPTFTEQRRAYLQAERLRLLRSRDPQADERLKHVDFLLDRLERMVLTLKTGG